MNEPVSARLAADLAGRTALHSACERGELHPVQACLTALSPAERHQALMQQDVWGDTPLHRALLQRPALPVVRCLLDYGAPPNAPGSLGRPPRLIARTQGHAALDAELAARGGHLALGEINEASWRSLIGELFGLSGTTTLGQVRLPLCHGIAEAGFPLLGQALQAVADDLRSAVDRADATRIAHALQAAGDNISLDPQALRDRIATGELVILPAGSPLHAVAYVWAGGHALRCDRGRRLLRPWGRIPCALLTPHAQRLGPKRLGMLQRAPFAPTPRAVWLAWCLGFGGASAPRSLREQVHAHPMRPQRVMNCVTASAKASIFAALCLAPGERSPQQTAQLYKQITTLLRWHLLAAYQARPNAPIDAVLIRRCEEKLRKPGRRDGLRSAAGKAHQSDRCVAHHMAMPTSPSAANC